MSRVLPILFNTEMVRLILDRRKTVTRREVKFPVNKFTNKIPDADSVSVYSNTLRSEKISFHEKPFYSFDVKPPYQPGDTLYVLETWCSGYDGEAYFYLADKNTEREQKWLIDYDARKWRPSIHMPKEAARIWLKVTDVRVERLKDITEESAKREGFSCRKEFIQTFLSMYPECTEDSWLWAIEFERCEKPESEG